MAFEYDVKNESGYDIIYLKGNLMEKHEAQAMLGEINEMVEQGHNKFLLHLKDLKYMNSSGLNVLIQLLTKTRTSGGDSVICHVSKKVNDLLIITKLNTLFKVADTKEDAMKLLG